MTGKTVILALAFGAGQLINYPLKLEVEDRANVKKCPVFTQQDLGAILDLKQKLIIANQPDKHISSLAIIRQFAQLAKLNGWTSVKLVAAEPHIWRCARDLRRVLPSVYIQEVPVKITYMWDMQSWVTSPIRWWSRELIIRLLPQKLYERLCN